MAYVFFAERYQWTPDQVDNLPAYIHARLPTHAAVLDEIQEARMKSASKGQQS